MSLSSVPMAGMGGMGVPMGMPNMGGAPGKSIRQLNPLDLRVSLWCWRPSSDERRHRREGTTKFSSSLLTFTFMFTNAFRLFFLRPSPGAGTGMPQPVQHLHGGGVDLTGGGQENQGGSSRGELSGDNCICIDATDLQELQVSRWNEARCKLETLKSRITETAGKGKGVTFSADTIKDVVMSNQGECITEDVAAPIDSCCGPKPSKKKAKISSLTLVLPFGTEQKELIDMVTKVRETGVDVKNVFNVGTYVYIKLSLFHLSISLSLYLMVIISRAPIEWSGALESQYRSSSIVSYNMQYH